MSRRVVTLTPIAVERDSRTFKQATSMSRLGYESIVVEHLPSEQLGALPFELLTVEQQPSDGRQHEVAGAIRRLWLQARGFLRRVGSAMARPLPTRFPHYVWVFLRRFGPTTARATPDADLYYLHSYVQYPAVYLRARRRRVPFIYDAHDFYSSFAPRGTRAERMQSWFRERIEAACVRRAAEVVTVSPGCANLIESRFGRRPIVVRNCADLRLDEPAGIDLRRSAGLGEDAFLIVLAGNWKPGLALDEALVALSRLPETVHLAFIGSGYGPHQGKVRRRGLHSRVHFLPPVRPTQVDDLIRSADVAAILYRGLTSSYVHMLPNGFFHAVGAGLPILYPDLPDIRAIAADYDFGLPIDPAMPDSVADQVRALLDDPGLLARLRANAERARESLNWEHEEQRLAELVERVLDARRP
jgi:glycosyltransferase involved in cell wall biosynthesis